MSTTCESGRLQLLSQLCLDYNQIVADVKNADHKRTVYQNRDLGLSLLSADEVLNRDNRSRIEKQLGANIGEESRLRYLNFKNFGCLEFLGDLTRKTSQDGSTPPVNAGFVAYDKASKQVVVVLLGSLKVSDYWLYNSNIRKIRAVKVWRDRLSVLPVELEGLEFHRGYALLALELSMQVDSILANAIEAHENNITSYLYTGHSLGAAAAGHMQLLKELENLQSGASLTTYGLLFAQPRSIVVVDKQGNANNILDTAFMRRLATRTLDFVVAKDVVPIASEMWPANFTAQERDLGDFDQQKQRGALIRNMGNAVSRFHRQCGQSAFGALGTRWEAGAGNGLLNFPSGSLHFANVYMKELTKTIRYISDASDDSAHDEMDWKEIKGKKNVDGTETWKWWMRSGFGESSEHNDDSDETATPLSSDEAERVGDELAFSFSSEDTGEGDTSEGCVVAAPRRCLRPKHEKNWQSFALEGTQKSCHRKESRDLMCGFSFRLT